MGERAPYSRVYWSIADDTKFTTIYTNNDHLATWTRLLLIADQAHPSSAHIPGTARKASVKALVEAGLVDLVDGGRYRIHGLDAERERRSNWATTRGPSGDRTVTERSPSGLLHQGLRLDETRLDKDEQQQDAPANDPWEAPEQPILSWLVQHGCDIRPGNGYHQKIITAVEVHGVQPMLTTLGRLAGAGVKQGDVKGFVFGAIDALNAQSRPQLQSVDREAALEEMQQERSRRIQAQMWERRMELWRETGQWDEAWGEQPKENRG